MSVIDFEVRGNVAIIRINRPEARNAVNGDVAKGLEEAIDRLESDEALWVGVLTGAVPPGQPADKARCSAPAPT